MSVYSLTSNISIPQKQDFSIDLIPVEGSTLGVTEFPLHETDIFSLESFRSIFEKRQEESLKFYVFAIKEPQKVFFIEASRFIEYYKKSTHKTNPVTNVPIEGSFELLKIQRDEVGSLSAIHHMEGEKAIIYPNYLFVLWNDHTRSQEERGEKQYNLGYIYEKGKYNRPLDLNKAEEYYLLSASLNFQYAFLSLGELYKGKNEQQATKWYQKAADLNYDIPQSYLIISDRIEKSLGTKKDIKKCVEYCFKASLMGNHYGLINLFRYYEILGWNAIANKWRQLLPQEWKDKSCVYIFKELQKNNFSINHTGAFEVPEHMRQLEEPEFIVISDSEDETTSKV